MRAPKSLLDPIRHATIRTQLLLIALVPALLTEIGLVAYFSQQTIAAAERELADRAGNAARHLAASLPYALISGNDALLASVLATERASSGLAYALVVDPSSHVLATAGEVPATAAPPHNTLVRQQPIRVSGPDLRDEFSLAAGEPRRDTLGTVVVGVDLSGVTDTKRRTLLHATALVALALALTTVLGWRLSNRLTGHLRHLGAAVGRITRGDLKVRAEISAGGEMGKLAAGINHMAETLDAHQGELQARIRAATASLAAKKDEAERANVAKSRFFAAASHDLRQPMHALSLFVAALKARNRQPEIEKLIDNVEASTAAMELLFNALLDISKLDAGVIEVNRCHFPVQKCFDDIRSQFAPVATEKGLRLRIRPTAAYAHSDPLLLERILINLVSNAIRYTDQGSVLVACRRRGSALQIGVWDTGRGIPAAQQDNVFQEFVQLANPERDRSKGLGLGLAIVSRLGRLLGHRIDLVSEPGRGSCFSILVPIGSPALALPAITASTPPAAIEGALVVLIDDEEAILVAMAELFDDWKIDLVAARSVADALHELDAIGRTPDIVVSDYRLPGAATGLDAIARVRAHFQAAIPAVLVTGDTSAETIQRISQAGFPILHKPLRPARLRALLTHLIRHPRQPVG
jgi:signal transduction histidine kinase/CheY-like chemotaxis protein